MSRRDDNGRGTGDPPLGVAVVGASHAAVHLADRLRAGGYTGPLTLIGGEPHLPYQRPPLSKAWLKGDGSATSLVLRAENHYADNGIELLSGTVAERADRDGDGVTLQLRRADGSRETRSFDRLVLATGAGVGAFFYPPVFALGVRIADRIPLVRRVAHKVERFLDDVGHYRNNRRLLMSALGLSLLFQFLAAVNVQVACLALDIHPIFLDVMVVTPVILLLSMVPVSPNNIGWWEWCFAVLLVGAGATAAEGLAVALILRAVSLLASLIGGLLLLRR